MNKKIISLCLLFLMGAAALAISLPVEASPASQVAYYTPTPRPDGRIIYIVKKGETCISISLLNGVTVDQIRLLNNITGDACTIYEGQELVLATMPPTATITAGPSPTPTPILPTATPFNGYGTVCMILFEDANGNAIAEEAELRLAGGVVSITNQSGSFSQTGETVVTLTGLDFQELVDAGGLCFKDLPEGQYNITIAIPQGYNPTSDTNVILKVMAGDKTVLNFGAQFKTQMDGNPTPIPSGTEDGSGNSSLLLGILGGIMILLGVGLYFYWRMLRR